MLPRLYPILDRACFADAAAMLANAEELLAAGVTLLQYRNKQGSARLMLDEALRLRALLNHRAQLFMNDRADLAVAAGCAGVHVGQDDLSPESARLVIGPNLLLGVSTHNPEQLQAAEATSANYLAIGPVFNTSSKERPDPVVGLEGVRRARSLTRKPLVAIGGITRQNARSVIDAGADSVAVIADLLHEPRKSAEEFFHIFSRILG
jgi:thiamine-phosphate pyrophosphorylase